MENSYFENGSFLNQINDENMANLPDFNTNYYISSPTVEYNTANNFPGINYAELSTEQQPIQHYQDYTNNATDQTNYSNMGAQFYFSQNQCENTNPPCNTTKCAYTYNDGTPVNGYYSKPDQQQYQMNSNNNNNGSDSLMQNVGFLSQSDPVIQQNQKSFISANQFNQVPQTYSTTYYQSPGYSYTPQYTNSVQRNPLKRKKMDDTTKPDEVSKMKTVKKRKKKGANEPQKPVSAYALFFRDTQAVIKSENPNSTFGEISKLVASMWDSLSEESKQVYKQKTEAAKRDYLKQLASFRANLISQGGFEQDDDDQPLSVIQGKMKETSSPNFPPPPRLQVAPSIQLKGITTASTHNVAPTSFYTSTPVFQNICMPPDSLYNYSNTQNVEQVPNMPPNTWASNPVPSSTPPPIQLRNMVPKAHSPVSFIASKPGQVIKVVPANQIADIQGKNKIIKMTDLIKPNTTSSGQIVVSNERVSQNTTPQLSPVKFDEGNGVQPILQTLQKESADFVKDSFQPQINEYKDQSTPVDTIDLTESSIQPTLNKAELKVDIDIQSHKNSEPRRPNVRICVHANCDQIAIADPQWSDEYCSNECVVAHCRDVFDAWTSMRQVTAKSE